MRHAILPLLLLSAAFAAPALATPADTPSPRTLTVSGTGIAKAAPDEASFSSGVVSSAPTAGQALSANSKAMNAVIATLKRQGVPDKSIQTSNLSLNPRYQTCKPNVDCPQKIVGYEVSNTVSVTVVLEKAGPVLDALVASGSNQIGGISFSVHDPKPLLNEARADAVKDAMEKATLYAKSAGVSLGPIQSIQDFGDSDPYRKDKIGAMRMMANVPVQGGEESITATVSITWTIQ